VLPSFLHPLRRYPLEQIERVVTLRFVEACSFRALEERLPGTPAASTHRDWCHAFASRAAVWLKLLTGWLAGLHPGMVLVHRAEVSEAAGLLAMALQAADWAQDLSAGSGFKQNRLLEGLWLWGSGRVKQALLVPTRCRAGPQP
jgi:hypothetical protein